jgi:hypothetical protein
VTFEVISKHKIFKRISLRQFYYLFGGNSTNIKSPDLKIRAFDSNVKFNCHCEECNDESIYALTMRLLRPDESGLAMA